MIDFIIAAFVIGVILAFYAQNKKEIDCTENKIKDLFG